MAVRAQPSRHWRSYGNDPLPTPAEALDLPLRAFPSWFLKITCDHLGQFPNGILNHTPGTFLKDRSSGMLKCSWRRESPACESSPTEPNDIFGLPLSC